MSDTPNDEQIIRGYDPIIMRRLLGFLRPHALPTIMALIALAVATASELLMPVVIQRTIDRHFLPARQRIEASRRVEAEAAGVDFGRALRIGDYYYLTNEALTTISGVDRRRLEGSNLLDIDRFYLFGADALPPLLQRDATLEERFFIGERHAALPYEQLSEVPGWVRRAITDESLTSIRRTVLLLIALLVAMLIFNFLQTYLISYSGQSVMHALRMRLFDHTLHQSLNFIGSRPVGKLVTRITNDVETINELFTNVLIELVKNGVMIIGVMITLFIINVRLGLIAIITLPPILIITWLFRGWARHAFRVVRERVSLVNAFLSEHLSGMSVVQMFGQERRRAERFRVENGALMRANLSEMYLLAIFHPLVSLFGSLSIACIIYFGAGLQTQGLVSLGVLIAFINLIGQFYRQIMYISDKFVILQSAMAGGERVFQLLDMQEHIPDLGTESLQMPPEGSVTFRSVCFAYKRNEPVLHDLSFSIQPGETVAIVGYTGAGKTTIANLLTRMWDVDNGEILIDGKDIRSIPLQSLRSMLQPIQQDVQLFRNSIEENITLGLPISGARVREAAALAQAAPFIERLPDGYQTMVEYGGTNLSTGQRQLIAFARTIIQDPRIIILDEATSSIDTETERLIQKGLEAVLAGRTSLVIAHRLSTIQNADRILVLANGRLIEEGSHNQLITVGGLYSKLYTFQYANS